MIYHFSCEECGSFTASMPMKEGKAEYPCPTCGRMSHREWNVDKPITSQLWACEGAHGGGDHLGSYGKHGDKLELLNKTWSEHYKEAPPPMDRSVPKNSREIT